MSNAFNAAALLVNKLMTFALLFLLAKLLGVSDYGVFSYYYVVITGIASVVGEGAAIALSRYGIAQRVSGNQCLLLSIVLLMAVGAGLLGITAAWLFPYQGAQVSFEWSAMPWWAFLFASSTVFNVALTGLMFSLGGVRRWPLVQLAQGGVGFVLVGAVALAGASPVTVLSVLSMMPLFAPAYGAWAILRAHRAEACHPVTVVSLKAFLQKSGIFAIWGGMLFGAPVHVICMIIFGKAAVSMEEVGYFNLFFLFYVLVTVVPASLSPYLIVRLMRKGMGKSSSYLAAGAIVAVVLPLGLYVAQGVWLCLLGEHVCARGDLLPYALIAGGLGLVVTQLVQVMHSANQSRFVMLAGLVYALAYFSVVGAYAVQGEMTANQQFSAFALALIAQLLVLGWRWASRTDVAIGQG
ncbi:hypothetical protein [Pseudomonas sp. RW3S2]|uniref:hypothetical protein n=1 Tax=Pseudomonas sp. RW3S2 TaxID=485884 RepID=UPI001648F7A6|nr:hypothetical protein [Pseudomonas sp. RW3S2]MBC3419412.1 hypothetical protein [Pseudomonas sp. RW3S2]